MSTLITRFDSFPEFAGTMSTLITRFDSFLLVRYARYITHNLFKNNYIYF
ncbi:hypothetical protein HanHA300_Chr16g0607961 [Helianthus annuus]|nr:hypothetical protein HanHA300_Chr16g0607961 [Helianthus annuus]KAJ0640689.1 hypothetical protein HanLR1_Chr16g0618511 [Helianthus annuus]